jgi:hypothetical protein
MIMKQLIVLYMSTLILIAPALSQDNPASTGQVPTQSGTQVTPAQQYGTQPAPTQQTGIQQTPAVPASPTYGTTPSATYGSQPGSTYEGMMTTNPTGIQEGQIEQNGTQPNNVQPAGAQNAPNYNNNNTYNSSTQQRVGQPAGNSRVTIPPSSYQGTQPGSSSTVTGSPTQPTGSYQAVSRDSLQQKPYKD